MKIVTEEFVELFKDYPLYSQEHEDDPLVIAKLFDPCGSASWFLLEYDPVEKIAFSPVICPLHIAGGISCRKKLGQCVEIHGILLQNP